MSLAGLKKQFNKANQYVSEKIGGAKGTELDDDFIEMERKTDVMVQMTEDIISRTHDYLQPNPASKAKMLAINSMAKLRGTQKNALYPQPEGQLGEAFVKYGKDFGEETILGQSLVETGESYKQMADIKYSLEDSVKQNFLEPLAHLQNKDLKEVMHHRKKMNGRRLDFDCKRRKKEKGSHITDEELAMAEEKFDESKTLAETAMHNLLENEVEQISQVQSFVESQISYHQETIQILQSLLKNLQNRRSESSSKPHTQYVPKKTSRRDNSPNRYDNRDGDSYDSNHTSNSHTKPVSAAAFDQKKPCCKAVFDFEPENEGELGFMEGEVITLIQQIDENWFEGTLNGSTGYFPINYVEVLVPLGPHF